MKNFPTQRPLSLARQLRPDCGCEVCSSVARGLKKSMNDPARLSSLSELAGVSAQMKICSVPARNAKQGMIPAISNSHSATTGKKPLTNPPTLLIV